MDTDLLRTFLEVNKTRHFGRAAENLFLTQSAVSFRIRQLESQLGTPVFFRKRGDLRLTNAGERLVPYAESILQTWGRARQEVALTDDYREQLTIGATPLIWEMDAMSDWLHQVQISQPDWAIRTEVIGRQDMSRAMLEKKVDVLLTSEPPRLSDIQTYKLADFELVIVASQPGQDMESIKTLPLVYLDWGGKLSFEHGKLPVLQRTPALHTHGCGPALNYLLNRGGAGFMPSIFVEQFVEDGRLHLVKDSPTMANELHLVWLANNEKADNITALVSGF